MGPPRCLLPARPRRNHTPEGPGVSSGLTLPWRARTGYYQGFLTDERTAMVRDGKGDELDNVTPNVKVPRPYSPAKHSARCTQRDGVLCVQG